MTQRLQWPKIRIAEDDLCFTAPGAFKLYTEQEPDDSDLYLGRITYGVFDVEQRLVEDFAGLTLYTIYARFFDAFLSIPSDEHLDRGLRYKGKYRVCEPMIVTQHDGYSDNHQEQVSYRSCFKDKKLFGQTL